MEQVFNNIIDILHWNLGPAFKWDLPCAKSVSVYSFSFMVFHFSTLCDAYTVHNQYTGPPPKEWHTFISTACNLLHFRFHQWSRSSALKTIRPEVLIQSPIALVDLVVWIFYMIFCEIRVNTDKDPLEKIPSIVLGPSCW